MRLIDADELLDLYSGKRLDDTFVPVPVIRQNIKDMPTVQPSTGWISVKDRLPESGDHVLVNCRLGAGSYVCDAFYAAKKSVLCSRYDYECECDCEYDEEDDEFYLLEGWYEVIKNWGDYSSVVILDEITHWMPLPEPFEEVKK